MSVANKDEALKCLDKARNFFADGNADRARHFADKANSLYPCPEVHAFRTFLQKSGHGPSSSSPRPTPAPQRSEGSIGSAAGTSRNGNTATSAQREMIARIRQSKGNYYTVLGVDRSADEDEIKKAYRKLALKLHPDKCQAPGAEEAFKEVSKAFSCLTDQDKRSFYDQTGHEDMASAAAARAGGGHGPRYRGHEIDPQDLFNMMFGGGMNGAFGMGPMHFGGFQQHPGFGQQRRQPQQQANPMAGPSGNPGLSAFIQSLQANPMRMIFLVAMVLQALSVLGPLIFTIVGWLFWGVFLGTPLWLICREIAAFERRQVYAPLRELVIVRHAVQSVQGYASAYMRFCQPAVSFADKLRLLVAELGRLVSVVFPIVLLLLTLLINTSSPPAAMSYSREYPHQLHTADRNVPYYVRDARRFEDTYPKASHQRQKFERSIESEYQADLQRTCHVEMLKEGERQRRYRNSGQPAPAKELPSCDKMYAFRNQHRKSNSRGKATSHGKRPPDNIIQHDEF